MQYYELLFGHQDQMILIITKIMYGICKDMTSSFNEVEELIENIHEKHVGNLIKVNTLEENVEKTIHNIKNILSKI